MPDEKPPPPDDLVGALHDPVHREIGRARGVVASRPQRNVAYIVPPHFAFIKHPHVAGVWLRVHIATLLAICPRCGVAKGDPCWNKGSPVLCCHWQRRRDAKGLYVRQDGIEIDVRLLEGPPRENLGQKLAEDAGGGDDGA